MRQLETGRQSQVVGFAARRESRDNVPVVHLGDHLHGGNQVAVARGQHRDVECAKVGVGSHSSNLRSWGALTLTSACLIRPFLN
jgi:hypothetical protein